MKPNRSLLKSISNTKHTGDLAEKLGEVALDSLLKEGLLKDIPVFGTAISLYKAGNDIAAYFFAKKIVLFLSEIETLPQEKRKEFVEKHCSDDNDIEHVGEITLMLIEKLDHPNLARLLGRAFRLLIIETISQRTFELYSNIIKNLNSYLIEQIKQFYRYENMRCVDSPAAMQLAIYGLIDINIKSTFSGNTKTMPKAYEKTEFGTSFYENILQDN